MFRGSALGWYLLVLAAAALAAFELFAMTHPNDRLAQVLGTLSALGVSLVLYFHGTDARALMLLVLLLPIFGLFSTLWRLGEIETAGLRAMASIATPLYVGGLLTSL